MGLSPATSMMGISGAQRFDILGEIRGIHPPRVAAIVRLEEILRRHVDHRRIVRRNLEWARSSRSGMARHWPARLMTLGGPPRPPPPPPAAARACGSFARGSRRRRPPQEWPARLEWQRRRSSGGLAATRVIAAARVGPDALLRAGAQIVAAHVAVLRFAVDDGPVGGILAGIEAVAARHREPVGIDRTGVRSAARSVRTTRCCPASRRRPQ